MADFLDRFINNLLHLEDGKSNKLIDLGDITCSTQSRSNEKTYLLSMPGHDSTEVMLDTIRERRGKASNQTVLNNSSLSKSAVVGTGLKWEWKDLNGATSSEALHSFIDAAYSELNLKGNNPMFLSVGSISWKVEISKNLETVHSPLLIFPIRLVRGSQTSLVEIDFVDDDAYFNPCFINMLREYHTDIASKFPHPNGKDADFDEALDLDKLLDGSSYFNELEQYIASKVDNQESFTLEKDTIAISLFNHSDICMYYDVRRNSDKIHTNKLIAKVFGLKEVNIEDTPKGNLSYNDLRFVLPKDSVQENLITRVANGESLVIKGPPGTGKTLTIANMIAVLLAQGKRVMFASKKISALAEVSNKLPENLRKFVMMLAYETEKQASAINTSTIRDEFRSIIRHRETYSRDTTAMTKLSAAMRAKMDATTKLTEYFTTVFSGGAIAGKNYYDAVDTYYQYSDLPIVNFAEPQDICMTTAEQLQNAKMLASEAGTHFAKMGGEKPVKYSAWLNAKNIEIGDPYPIYSEVCNALYGVFDTFAQLGASYGVEIEQLPIGILTVLAGQKIFDAKEIGAIAALAKDDELFTSVCNTLAQYRQKQQQATDMVVFNGDAATSCLKKLLTLNVDRELTIAQLNRLYDNKELFYKDGKLTIDPVALGKLLDAVDKIAEMKKVARASELEAILVFDKPIEEKQSTLILKAYDTLKDFQNGEKPGFWAKSYARKLKALSSDPTVTFEKLVKATVEYHNYYQNTVDVATFMRMVSTILGGKELITEEQYDVLALTLNRSRANNLPVEKYWSQVEIARNLLQEGSQWLTILSSGVTLDALINAFDLHLFKDGLLNAIAKCCTEAQIAVPDAELEEMAVAVIAALRLGKYSLITDSSDEQRAGLLQALVEIERNSVEKLNLVIAKLSEVGYKYFSNYYTASPADLSIQDLRYFVTQALDRGVAGSAIRYYEIVDEINAIMPVYKLFDELESGAVTVDTTQFAELLEHSFLSIVLRFFITLLGNRRNGMGHNAVVELDKFDNAEKTMQQLNAQIIEQSCLEQINPSDDDFGFLANDRGAKLTMRGLFKTYASAVWKLKRCFILSPSTASVLFRPEIYNDFDVVIVDEASQLEPVYLLPILVRSKQCVLVGDEHQMPPITHFKAKNNSLIEDYERELVIDKDISALSLALVNQAFDTEELSCHYRSNTESLIAFSQKAFYPYMRTFPAALPFAEGLGFVDVLVEDGRCEGGVNPVEVNKTVELLREHFDKHFDRETGRLAENSAIGVVAFGESQLSAIIKKVEADEELFTMISRARNAVDVGDKAVFFRTIESVQGQETDHLILSLTYGKDKNGKPMNRFGELNRDDFGKCIFNVAVTRARSSVTLVRSVEPYELDSNSRIGFIVDYMRLVKQFSQDSKQQFVTNKIGKGAHFVDDVVRYIKSQGIDEERIVIGYGVTEGSVRIPIAILSRDMKSAVLGVWCELPIENRYNFFDYNLRYYNSLVSRNWNMHRVSIHEWFDNSEAEKRLLNNKLQQII